MSMTIEAEIAAARRRHPTGLLDRDPARQVRTPVVVPEDGPRRRALTARARRRRRAQSGR